MSILSDILNAILGTSPASARVGGPAASKKPAGAAETTATMSKMDVAAILDKKAKAAGEKLNWRKSIVDLMKLLGLDSSMKARNTLADELNYSGDKNNSAEMNVWLHKQVMTKLAANGGIVPKELQG